MKDLEVKGLDQKTVTEVVRKAENVGGQKIGEQFLPFYTVPTMETMWDVVHAVSPLADFRAKDGEAKIRGKQAFDRAYADLIDMAEKERFNASDVAIANMAGVFNQIDATKGQVPNIAEMLGNEKLKNMTNSVIALREAIENRLEWLRINALLGKISYSGKVKFDVDYAIPGNQTGVTPSVAWSTVATSDPLGDILTWQEVVRDATGLTPDIVIMSSKALRYVMQSTALKTAMQYTNPLMSVAKAKEIIESNANVKIIAYDAQYTDEAGTTRGRYLAEDKIIMLPSKAVLPKGVGDVATMPHVLAGFQAGFYSWQKTEMDPYMLEIGVGLTAFPRIKHPEALFNAKVY